MATSNPTVTIRRGLKHLVLQGVAYVPLAAHNFGLSMAAHGRLRSAQSLEFQTVLRIASNAARARNPDRVSPCLRA